MNDLVFINFGVIIGLRGKVESINVEEVYLILIESVGYSLKVKVPKGNLIKEK